MLISCPNKLKKFKQTFSNMKTIATVLHRIYFRCISYRNPKGVLLVEFMKPVTTINANMHYQTFRRLQRDIQNKRRRMLSYGIVLIHDNPRSHTSGAIQQLLAQIQWEVFNPVQTWRRVIFTISIFIGWRQNSQDNTVAPTCFNLSQREVTFCKEGTRSVVCQMSQYSWWLSLILLVSW